MQKSLEIHNRCLGSFGTSHLSKTFGEVQKGCLCANNQTYTGAGPDLHRSGTGVYVPSKKGVTGQYSSINTMNEVLRLDQYVFLLMS